MAFLTRNSRGVFAVVCLIAVSGIACAGTSQRGPRVVWVRGDRVYVTSPDSAAFDAGTILTFKDRGKKVATGEVTAVHDGELIAARLTSGSFKKVKHLERLEVTSDHPVLRALPLLRIGCPAPGRKNLLFNCPYESLDASIRVWNSKAPALHSEVLDDRTYRLVRDSTISFAGSSSWPETLLVRRFDEVADEEIALERGDIDVGFFWPGEASVHIRQVMGWKGLSDGIRRGDLTVSAWRAHQTGESIVLDDEWEVLERTNRELFRDDLVPVRGSERAPGTTVPGRFEVDPSLPGRDTIERYLNRAVGAGTPIDSARVIRLQYDELSPDVPGLGAMARQSRLIVSCPVISNAKFRHYLERINVEALRLFQCLPAVHKP